MFKRITAILAGTPVCAVILDNSGWISIKGGQETFFGRSAWTDFRTLDGSLYSPAFGVGGAQASATVSNASGVLSGQTASSADPGYYGTLTAKSPACVVLERKDASAHWVRDGFAQGQLRLSELRACYNRMNGPSEEWRIHLNEGYFVYGLRYVSNTGQIKVLCENSSGSAWVCASKLA